MIYNFVSVMKHELVAIGSGFVFICVLIATVIDAIMSILPAFIC